MRFFSISLVVPAALAATVSPRDTACFDMTKGVCLGRTADATNALVTINNACAKISTCTPGSNGRVTVTGTYSFSRSLPRNQGILDESIGKVANAKCIGKVTGFPYTATLRVGNLCAGITTWSQDACVDLFRQYVDVRCAPGGSPAGQFQRMYLVLRRNVWLLICVQWGILQALFARVMTASCRSTWAVNVRA